MKKPLFFLSFVLLFNTLSSGQYRINKTRYDRRTYIYQPGDPYKPEAAGIASLLIPGLGQALCGETGRGLLFFGSSVAWATVFSLSSSDHGANSKEAYNQIYIWFWGQLAINVISMIDASRVAKVNNLAWRDRSKSTLKLEFQPFISSRNYIGNKKITAGISLRLTFMTKPVCNRAASTMDYTKSQ